MTSTASSNRRYLALFLPWLPAERAIRASAAPPDTAFALTAQVGGARRVVAVSPAAGAGLAGLTLADARAREPGLATVDDDPAADAALVARLADACERFSPTVAVWPPATVLIDLTGCVARGGEAALVDEVVALAARGGLTARPALAATPDAAAALARCGGAEPAKLPLAALDADAETLTALRRSGLRTIGDLARRPAAVLAARFGADLPSTIARLMGREDRRLVPRRTPPAIVVEERFADPVAATAAVQAALDRLIARAVAALAERGAGGRAFAVALFRADGHVARLEVASGRATRDAAVVARLFAERIESLADPLDPGFGYDLVRLGVAVAEPLLPAQADLYAAAPSEAVGDLVARLTTRLGASRVRRLASGDSHVPEQAAFDLPVRAPAVLPWRPPPAGEPPLRPLALFTPPQRIEVIAEVPDGPPRTFRWRRARHDVARAEGPERIAPEWWRDDDARPRDYYRLEDVRGRRFWVFRDGLFDGPARPEWYLHGLFA